MAFLGVQVSLTLSPPLLHRRIVHQILLNDGLRVLYVVEILLVDLVKFFFDVGASEEGVVL